MIAVIGAHPDDAEIGAGGWIARERGLIIAMTNGNNCTRDERIAANEQERAAEILGADAVNLGYSELKAVDQGMVSLLDDVFENADIDTVITHGRDTNQEHTITREAVLAASRRIERVLLFEPIPPSRPLGFQPHMYVDISEHIEQEIEAIKQYKSQQYRQGRDLVETRTELDRWRGCEIGVEYSECYEVVRWKL